MVRVIAYLKQSEYETLCKLAERELRDPRAQAVFILRRELERLSLSLVEIAATESAQPTQPIQPEAVGGLNNG